MPPKSTKSGRLGNTTVRSPFRLADAIRILQQSTLRGALNTAAAQARYLQMLHDEGFLRQAAEGETASWNGRKWRAAMYHLWLYYAFHSVRGLSPGVVDEKIATIASLMPGLTSRQLELDTRGPTIGSRDDGSSEAGVLT